MNEIKYKYSLTFYKKGLLVFLSQLDMMRLFGRVLQRSGLPVAYSQGFNPHPRYSLPYPLPVGYTGTAEILEIYLTAPAREQDLPEILNRYLPADIQILSAVFGSLAPKYFLRVILEKEVSLPENWPELVLTKETKRGRVDNYVLGEHVKLTMQGRELHVISLTDKTFKAERICALLDIGDIEDVVREINC